MNYYEATTANSAIGSGPVDMTITASKACHGTLPLRRILPAADRAAIGPFLLFDHFGPTASTAGSVIDFPAPTFAGCIALTYLFDGSLILNGSVASKAGHALHGIHTWLALPADLAIDVLALEKQAAGNIPNLELGELTIRVVAGEIYGQASPVLAYSHALCLVCDLPQAREFKLPSNYQEMAVYVISGCIQIDGIDYFEGSMAVAASGWPIRIRSEVQSRVAVFGGMASALSPSINDLATWAAE